MGIVMECLRPIYFQMKQSCVPQACFAFQFGAVSFRVFFRIEKAVLASLTFVKDSNFALRFVVRPGFKVDTDISVKEHVSLRRVLGLELDPKEPLSLHTFLKALEACVPTSLAAAQAGRHLQIVFRAAPKTASAEANAGFGGMSASGEHLIAQPYTRQRRSA